MFVFSLTVVAQSNTGIIEGIILDADNGETIPLVSILKMGSTKGTSSDIDGEFQLELSEGQHSLRFSSISYRDSIYQVQLSAGDTLFLTIELNIDRVLLGEIVVSGDRVTRLVQSLAAVRDEQNEGLKSYEADLYKLAILGSVNDSAKMELEEPFAFSERVSNIRHLITPERYSETLMANRASENFFSEYDFFSTGGPPLNLNQEQIPISILSEDITVIGPISTRAGRFYFLDDKEAGPEWPVGTKVITFTPKLNNRPLFIGSVWVNEVTSEILGMDVRLNEYASTNTGLFSISNLRYQQTYTEIDGFWLPKTTKLSANLSLLTAKKTIIYTDEWTWQNHRVNNEELQASELKLNTSLIEPDAHQKSEQFWAEVSESPENTNKAYLAQAKTYSENNKTLSAGMSVMSTFFRLPYQMERFYFSNFSDFYHFNRVEGHTLGIGLRTPVNPNFELKGSTQYGFARQKWTYKLNSFYFFKYFPLAPDVTIQKDVVEQYQDYEYNRTPIDFFEFRHTLNSLLFGTVVNNYFEREGVAAGFRLKFNTESFLRVRYLSESHNPVQANTNFSLFEQDSDPALFPNSSVAHPFQEGDLRGLSFHLHHDTRKYLRTQFLRDYNIRDFGWLADIKLEIGKEDWNSDFNYQRYRVGLKFNVPVFSAHFIQTDVIFGASTHQTPSQRLFSYNGFVLDDYVRERPFNTVSFKEPVGHRVSVLRLKYKFGSSITRKIPIQFIRKSGIHLATFFTAGVIDDRPSLEPLLPYSNADTQAELGIAAFKIFGFLYVEFSRRLVGEYGNSIGLQVLF